jgi:RecA/RadA recombinase
MAKADKKSTVVRGGSKKKVEKEPVVVVKKKIKAEKESKIVKAVSIETPEQAATNAFLLGMYTKRMDQMERKYALTSSELSIPDRLSSGTLCMDLICGGGYVPGTMVQISGMEKGGKSTACMTTLGSAVSAQIPIIQYWDAENALNDPRYAEAVIRHRMSDLFYGPGRKARLYQESVLEDFYNGTKSLMRTLPDKLYRQEDKTWYFVFDQDQTGRKLMGDFGFKSYEKTLFRDTNRLWCPTNMTGLQGIVFCDSYPALVTADEDEAEESSKGLALDARAFSKNIKKVKGVLKRKAFLLIGVNQIRLNPGVKFGCLHGDTQIPFVDGSSFTIAEVVKRKLKGPVWAFNEKTGKFAPKPITDWFNNGKVDEPSDWVTITTDAVETKNGVISVTVTPNHKEMTKKGWKSASKLHVGQELLSKYRSIVNGTLEEFLYGVLLGDSTLVVDSPNVAHFRLRDNQNQAYVDWKMEQLAVYDFKPWKNGIYASTRSYELARLAAKLTGRNPSKIAHKLTPLSIAVHYMDDGCLHKNAPQISYKRFQHDPKMMRAIAKIYRDLGFSCTIWKQGVIAIDAVSRDAFFKAIRKYIPDPMQYKLPDEHKGCYKAFKLSHTACVKRKWVAIKSVEQGSDRKFRQKDKYDIKVADSHCYLAGNADNGILLHNSSEYEPGGNALKFYSDVRSQARPRACPEGWGKGISDEGKPTSEYGSEPSVMGEGNDSYSYTFLKNTKNKTGLPYLGVIARIWFRDFKGRPHGYDPVFDVYQYLKITGRLKGGIKEFKITGVPELEGQKIAWKDFKRLVLAEYFMDKEMTSKAMKNLSLGKPLRLRKRFFSELKMGKTFDLLNSKSEKEEVEVDLEAD